jgi:hypothetical protein
MQVRAVVIEGRFADRIVVYLRMAAALPAFVHPIAVTRGLLPKVR